MTSGAAADLAEAAARAAKWAGEPFLRPDEDPARRARAGNRAPQALDEALAEIEAGSTAPSHSGRSASA